MKIGRRLMQGVGAGLAVVVLGLVGASIAYLASVAPSGTGYQAQTICSAVFISGRDPASLQQAEFQGLHPLLKLIDARIDRRAGEVSASLFGLGAQKSVYRPGLGCTLADTNAALSPAPAALTAPRPRPDDAIERGPGPLPPGVDAQRLNAALDRAFAEPNPAELQRTRAVIVLKDGRPIAERYAPGFNKDMPLAGYSMTKTIMGALTGVLIDRGRLRLEQSALVPNWTRSGDARRGITVDHLLHMTSGLRWVDASRDPRGDPLLMAYHDRDVSALAISRPLAHPPGTVFNYSSGAANILPRVMLDAMGGDRDAYLALPRTAIFDRIGMHSAVVSPDASGVLFGSTQGYATARDWARFGELYRNGGQWNGVQVLPKGWVGYSSLPEPATQASGYGAMIWVNRGAPHHPEARPYPLLPEDTLMMIGQFGQMTAVEPNLGVVIVRLGETHAGDTKAARQRLIADILAAVHDRN
jgi:CubicO group peptidase (beta-lactamase class C family)